MPAATLPDRAVIAVSGPDAQHFLHNVLTCNIEGLTQDTAMPGALLTPQGKILFDFMAMRAGEDRFLLDCRTDIAADFIKRLIMYRLRAKAEIAEQKEMLVGAFWENDSGDVPAGVVSGKDIRFAQTAVTRTVGPATAGSAIDAWTALRIANGVAESGSDYTLGDAFPHDVNLDQIGGVSFKKGCYVGQEVVSRMQHRGSARRRILIASAGAPLPASGTEISAGGKAVGALGTVQGKTGLALCRIDRVKDAVDGGTVIEAGGAALALAIPPGANFGFPETSETAGTDA